MANLICDPALKFDEVRHEYHVNGKRLPNVSEILNSCGLTDLSGIPADVLEVARVRGKAVHLACHYIDNGILKWESVDPAIAGYVQSYMGFRSSCDYEVLLSELPLHSDAWRFAGTPDKIAKVNGTTAVVDLKTGLVSRRSTEVQTAAYYLMVREKLPDLQCEKRFELKLYADGAIGKLIGFPHLERDINIFTCAATVHWWKLGAA